MGGHNVKQIMDAVNLQAQPCGTIVAELGKCLAIKKRQVYRVIETLQDRFKFIIKDKSVGGDVRYYL